MALLKEITDSKGVTCGYHKIERISLDGNVLIAEVASYTSQEFRDIEIDKRDAEEGYYDGKNIVARHSYWIHITIEEEESMGIRKLAYQKLKTLPDWEGAEDC